MAVRTRVRLDGPDVIVARGVIVQAALTTARGDSPVAVNRTSNVCAPGARLVNVAGDVHAAKAAGTTRHS